MERAAAATEEAIHDKVNLLRESMRRSEAIHGGAAAAFTSITARLAAIDDAVRPAEVRKYDACRVHDNVRRSLRAVLPILRRPDLVQQAENVILNRPSKDLGAYLDAVDKLRSVDYFFNSKRSYGTIDSVLKHVDELLGKAAVELENEFHRLLSKCSKPVELECLFNSLPSLSQTVSSENSFGDSMNPSSEDSSGDQINVHAAYTLPVLIDSRCIPLLSKLVDKSVQLRHHQQFLNIYRDVRGSTLELNIKSLGVEYVTAEEMQNAQAENLNAEIAQWIQFYRIGVKLLFAAERKLCDQIFEGKQALKDHCFAQLTEKSLSILLSFGHAVAKSQTSPEKLFVLLDMYEATMELQSDVEMVFEGHACSENRKSALGLKKCLEQTAERTLSNFKGNILKDSPESTTADGAVHLVTSYVVNYVAFLFDYQSSLKQVLKNHVTGDGTESDLVSRIMDLVHALETNLEAKSKQYEDHCLAHLFLMNNIQYIIKSICRSEFKDLVGDDWIQRRRRIVQQHATQYRRISWGKALEFLSAKGLTSSLRSTTEGSQGSVPTIGPNSSTISKSVIKERFRSFNMQFEEVCQTQINWVIPDRELRDNLILAIAEILIPAYRDFLKHFGSLVGSSRNPSKYIKYSPDALEEALVITLWMRSMHRLEKLDPRNQVNDWLCSINCAILGVIELDMDLCDPGKVWSSGQENLPSSCVLGASYIVYIHLLISGSGIDSRQAVVLGLTETGRKGCPFCNITVNGACQRAVLLLPSAFYKLDFTRQMEYDDDISSRLPNVRMKYGRQV